MPEKEAKDEKLGSTEVSAANEKSAKSKKPKPTKKSSDESFNWTNGTSLEKAGFIGSMLFLVAAVVFLVFEFIHETAEWPYIWFNITIGCSFLCETLTHFRLKRNLAIVSGVCGLIFIVIGVLKLCGVM